MGLESKLEQQANQMEQLIEISLISEEMRKKFSESLRMALAKNEAMRNENFNHKMGKEISQHTI